jgi:hypothetical protein
MNVESARWQSDDSVGPAGAVRPPADQRSPDPIHDEGAANERRCVLCKEEGRPNETAHGVVTIRPRSGGEPRKVAVCSFHLEGLGEATSPYVVDELARSFPTRGSAKPRAYVPGKRKGGDIPRTMRRAERYGRTQRGRLGE